MKPWWSAACDISFAAAQKQKIEDIENMAGSQVQRVSCGRDLHCCPDITISLKDALKSGFDFICAPLVNPRFQREFLEGAAKDRPGPLTRSDLLLNSNDWGTLVVAKVSPWLQLDSCHDAIRRNSEKALVQELTLACHLAVPAILISLNQYNCINLARLINEHIQSVGGPQFWIQLPLKSAKEECGDVLETSGASGDAKHEDTWTWWHRFRTLCNSNKRLGAVLELSADLPSKDAIDRWSGEPVKALVLSTHIFLTNKKGFPVLSRAHQLFVKQFFKLDVQLILTGKPRHAEKGIQTYHAYLDHIYQTRDPPDNISQFAKGYEDFLQCPLQPLMDNLESQTYEVFEKDPIKYSLYQQAVYAALMDKIPEAEKDTRTIVVMVLGAGRGPLVTASLRAATMANRKIKVYAVEKNPNAVVTLENLKLDSWGDQVTIISCDMRFWNAPEKADIIVSELLGSFGDNELSPECLDGAQRFLKEDSISIPYMYTSYLAPLQSSKLWNEARLCRDKDKSYESHFETPYVVRLHNSKLLDEPQPLFTFKHPNNGVVDNSRYGSLEFKVGIDSVLHGFGGYFHCLLYRDIALSIVPSTHSPGMFSWFPIYFPIQDPLYLREGDKLRVHFWRACNTKNVWYEWCITDPVNQPIHNPKGRSYTIGL